jgi:hypothetical protein
MRPTFALDLDLRPVSVNAPIAQPHVLRVGDVFFMALPYATEHGAVVPEGTKFFVSHINEDDGTTWLLAEGDVPALFHWDNMLAIVPYDTEDVLPCLRAALRCPVAALAPCDGEGEPLPPSNVRSLVTRLVVAAMLTMTFAPTDNRPAHVPTEHATHSAGNVELLRAQALIRADATG